MISRKQFSLGNLTLEQQNKLKEGRKSADTFSKVPLTSFLTTYTHVQNWLLRVRVCVCGGVYWTSCETVHALPGPIRSCTAAATGCGLRVWAGPGEARLVPVHAEALRHRLVSPIETITWQTWKNVSDQSGVCLVTERHLYAPVCTREQVFVVTIAVRSGATVGASGSLPLPDCCQQGQLRGADRTLTNARSTVASIAVLGWPPRPFRGAGHFLVLLGEEDRCPASHLWS